MTQDLYLRTATQSAMDSALAQAGLIDGDGKLVEGVSLDRVGPFSRITGYDGEGRPVKTEHPDYHCNVRIADGADVGDLAPLEAISVLPSHPFRVWG